MHLQKNYYATDVLLEIISGYCYIQEKKHFNVCRSLNHSSNGEQLTNQIQSRVTIDIESEVNYCTLLHHATITFVFVLLFLFECVNKKMKKKFT